MRTQLQLVTSTPTCQIVTVTPQLVDDLLAMNTKNRSPRQKHIDQLCSEIADNHFLLTASGVGVSKSGVLLDGQHRLIAIKKSGYPPIQIVLATGLDDESQSVVDRHAKRSISDSLSLLMNMTVTTNMVAMIQALHTHKASVSKTDVFVSLGQSLHDAAVSRVLSEIGEEIHEAAIATSGLRASVAAAILVYMFHERDKAIAFAAKVKKGVGLQENDAAYRLRVAIDRLKGNQGSAGRLELLKLSVSACIHDSNNAEVKMLKPHDSWCNAPWRWNMPNISEM